MLNSNEISEINIVPFVDIVLVLLIIFMATATFAKKESVKVNLPSATTSKNQTSNDKPFVITVTKEGEIYCEEILVKEQNLNECFAKNKSFENGILLRSDLETPFKFVVKVIDECKKNSVEKFALEVKSAKKDSFFPFLLFSLLIHAGLFASMCQIKPPIKTQKQLNEEKIKFVEMEVLIVEKMNDDKSKESEILKIKPDENFISKTKEAKKENKKPSIKKIEKKAPNIQVSEKIKNSTKEPIAKTIESNFQENENIEKNSEDNQDENPNITTQECSLAPNVSQYKEHISARDEFLKEIWKKVRSNLNYPIQARKMKFSGETTVRFEVDLNGEVVKSSLKVEKSSGKVILDNAAMDAVLSSSPFEKNSHLPIDILVPIAFKLN